MNSFSPFYFRRFEIFNFHTIFKNAFLFNRVAISRFFPALRETFSCYYLLMSFVCGSISIFLWILKLTERLTEKEGKLLS